MSLPAWIDRVRSQMPAIRALTSARARTTVIFIATALCIATFGPALAGAAGLPMDPFEAFVFHACGPFCHQAPSRTFWVAGHALPLCVRCTGMWIGITLGVAIGVAAAWKRRWSVGLVAAAIAFALSGVDHLREESGRPGWPWVRFGLGLVLFLGVTFAVSFDALSLLLAGGRWLRRALARRQG
jgi:uncharacterized membrane protein